MNVVMSQIWACILETDTSLGSLFTNWFSSGGKTVNHRMRRCYLSYLLKRVKLNLLCNIPLTVPHHGIMPLHSLISITRKPSCLSSALHLHCFSEFAAVLVNINVATRIATSTSNTAVDWVAMNRWQHSWYLQDESLVIPIQRHL